MPAIPKKWIHCDIGEVTQIVSGSTPSPKDPTNFTEEGGMPWITPNDLRGYKNIYISRGARNLSEKGLLACSAIPIPKGSVLFSSRAPIGYVAIASNELTTNQGFKNFVLPFELDSRFLYFYLRHIKPIAELMATGTTFKELSGSKIARLPLLIAPLNEQKRISDKLEALLARIDVCQLHLERIPLILKRFRQSVVNDAISGKLTRNWKPRNQEFEYWKTKSLESICIKDRAITYGVIKLGEEYPGGVPCLRTSNVRWLRIDIQGLKRIKPELSNAYERTVLQGNEVLVNVRGTLGGVWVVEPNMIGWNVSREVAIVPIDTTIAHPKYIAIWIASTDPCTCF